MSSILQNGLTVANVVSPKSLLRANQMSGLAKLAVQLIEAVARIASNATTLEIPDQVPGVKLSNVHPTSRMRVKIFHPMSRS